jgi:hypothetical protein
MKSFSEEFLNQVSDRIMKIKKATEETGIDITQDLVKTLGELSEISKLNASNISSGSPSEEELEGLPYPQPTNSLLSILSSDSGTSFITSIKNKNEELQKTCCEKIYELRNTTKEFCTANKPFKYNSTRRTTVTDITGPRKEDKTTPELHQTGVSDFELENILEELSILKTEVSEASARVAESNNEIAKQAQQNLLLKQQLQQLLNQTSKTSPSCGCRII